MSHNDKPAKRTIRNARKAKTARRMFECGDAVVFMPSRRDHDRR